MDAPTVVVSERLGPLTEEERRVESVGARVVSAPLWTHEQIATRAADALVIVAGAVEPLDETALSSLPRLGAVVRRGVGCDNVDLVAASTLGVVVANVPDASIDEVSDHALSLLLALERRLVDLDRGVRSGAWDADPVALQRTRTQSRRFCGLTLGIVGMGRIGRALARKATAIYSSVVAYDPVLDESTAAKFGVRRVALDELLSLADHVSLHVPMSRENRHLLGAAQIAAMRPGAVLVNAARGGVVDEAALIDALAHDRLGGVGLDVTESEPLPRDSALLGVDGRLLLTAHSAAWSKVADHQLATASVDAALDLLQSRLPSSVVNPDVLTSPRLRLPLQAVDAR